MKVCQPALVFLLIIVANLSCGESFSRQTKKSPLAETEQAAEFAPPEDFSPPAGWTLFPQPRTNSREMQCANAAVSKEWKVETENGTLKISKYVHDANEQITKLPPNTRQIVVANRNIGAGLAGELHVESYENGWLIGSDAGEWGGKLFWFDERGIQQSELLADNIRGIFKLGGEVFILSGMAHLSIDEGKISKLAKDEKGNLKTQIIGDLRTQPQTFVVENEQSALIALKDKILRLQKTGALEELSRTNTGALYPNSMAVDSAKVIYVGMRLFVVRFVPDKGIYREEWLVPQNCQKFNEKDFECVCQGEK